MRKTRNASCVTATTIIAVALAAVGCERRSGSTSGAAGAASSQSGAPSASVPPPRYWLSEKDCSLIINVPWPSEWELAYFKQGKFSIGERSSGRRLFEGVHYVTIGRCSSHWVMDPTMEERYTKRLEFRVLSGVHEELFVSGLPIPLHGVWHRGSLQVVQVFPLSAPMWDVRLLEAGPRDVTTLLESLGRATWRVWGEHERRGVGCSRGDVARMTRRSQNVPAVSPAEAAERFLSAQARHEELTRDAGKRRGVSGK